MNEQSSDTELPLNDCDISVENVKVILSLYSYLIIKNISILICCEF